MMCWVTRNNTIRCLKQGVFIIGMLAFNSACTQTLKFDFGTNNVAQGYTKVLPGLMYNDTAGFGFEWSTGLIARSYKGNDDVRNDYICSKTPFYFSVKLPGGNYNVSVVLGDKKGTSKTTIKAECRRLMVEEAVSNKGQFITAHFTVHVRDSIIHSSNTQVHIKPREVNYLHWDNKLTLEFNNSNAKVCAVEIEPASNCTTVFLAGNSTVVDQAEEPWAAWGQMIPAFFKPGEIAIANYAESGETLLAFKREKRLEKIWSSARPGDYLFIEFAHNDQKPGANHLDPFTTYQATLKEWIATARSKNIIPVLVTSMHRRSFDSTGHIMNTLLDYPEAMRQTAKEESVPLIDLNAMSKIMYEAWGPVESVKAFVHFPANTFPNQTKDLKDDTHFSTYGAFQLAKCVAQAIKENMPQLAVHLKDDLPDFNPAKPDSFYQFHLPLSSFIAAIKPDGN